MTFFKNDSAVNVSFYWLCGKVSVRSLCIDEELATSTSIQKSEEKKQFLSVENV